MAGEGGEETGMLGDPQLGGFLFLLPILSICSDLSPFLVSDSPPFCFPEIQYCVFLKYNAVQPFLH